VKNGADDRCSQHLLDAAMILYGTGEFTAQQVLDGLNSRLTSPLAGAELTDLTNIRAQLDAQGTTTLKIVYTDKIRAAGIAGEVGAITEAKWRSILGIA
jgi:hypothetical protein